MIAQDGMAKLEWLPQAETGGGRSHTKKISRYIIHSQFKSHSKRQQILRNQCVYETRG